MNQNDLLALHKDLCEKGRELMARKNADYANGADPFHNFRMSRLLHIPEAKGVLLRMQDKMARMVSLIDRGDLKVKEESISDTILDLINYSIILCGLLEEMKTK